MIIPLAGRRDGLNFDYRRQLSYAEPQSLKDIFGEGHYDTVKVRSDR
ncbi:putative integrase [Pseudomonas sp. LBUM920]|nr:putative integrase [Pseudomonas sp. LBUM920]